MKKIRKMLPVSLYDISGTERWLEEQANNGLFPVKIGSLVTFTETGRPGTRFRLEAYGKCGSEPSEEQLALYRNAGWEYAFDVGGIYFLFYTTERDAVDLYSDKESRGLSLERLEKAAGRVRRIMIAICLVFVAAIVGMIFLQNGRFSIQTNMPLILLKLTKPASLMFIGGAILLLIRYRRDFKILRKSCEALKAGLEPPETPSFGKKIVFENIMLLVLMISLIVLLIGNMFNLFPPYRDIPPEEFKQPYIAIQSIESTPVYRWNDLFDDPPVRNVSSANTEYSLLAPTWYSVTQEAYSAQCGSGGSVFSKDPENGTTCYAPELKMTYFKLLIPTMSRRVAESQMNEYRLANLKWHYEEIDFPSADFVIIADEEEGIWQMAALGKGCNVAVFLYGGQENLREHLELLSDLLP